jgi:hypothetical protein
MLCTRQVKLPRGLKKMARQALKNASKLTSWSQDFVEGPMKDKLIGCCKYKGRGRRATVLLHVVTGGVDNHSDGYAKSSFMFPVILNRHWFFEYEGNAYRVRKNLEPGKMYRFNDHNRHGLNNSLGNYSAVLFTVSFEDK